MITREIGIFFSNVSTILVAMVVLPVPDGAAMRKSLPGVMRSFRMFLKVVKMLFFTWVDYNVIL